MSRSRGPVPKSRAKLRGRLDRSEPEPKPERARLLDWIAGWLDADRLELASLDLRGYLSETACFELDAGERLRLLAVHYEPPRLLAHAAKRGWLTDELRARFEATLTANDERWVVDDQRHHSGDALDK